MTRFLKIGRYYVNMKRIDTIQHCAGNVAKVSLRDGKYFYCSVKDVKKMKIVEKP